MKTIYHLATRGGRYSIALQQTADGTFQIREFKHHSEVGCFSMGSADRIMAGVEYSRRINDYAKYDGIHFIKTVPNHDEFYFGNPVFNPAQAVR
jgi:hypothetical protein